MATRPKATLCETPGCLIYTPRQFCFQHDDTSVVEAVFWDRRMADQHATNRHWEHMVHEATAGE
jgi:hypothetical protein